MSDENLELPSGEETEQEPAAPVLEPYEEEARSQGWKPKDEYEGDPDKWRPAKEFYERGELFGKIDSMGRELKETRKAMKMLQEHNSQIKQAEYNNALKELKALQKKHLQDGEADEYLATSELLSDLKAEQKAREVLKEVTPAQVDPRFTSWIAANKWYETDQVMRDHADIIGQRYAAAHPDVDPEDVLKIVTQEVRKRFSDKFTNPNRTKPGAVGGSDTPNTPKSKVFNMSDEEKKVMNTFIRTGVMTKDEYVAQLKLIRGEV